MSFAGNRKIFADWVLMILVILLIVAYNITSLAGINNQFHSGHWMLFFAVIISAAVLISFSAKLFLQLRWEDAWSLLFSEIWRLGISGGIFLEARDALGLHWINASLLTLPALVLAFAKIHLYSITKTPAALAAKAAALAMQAQTEQLASGIEAGSVYEGKVEQLMKFGAFITIAPGVRGLVHVSQMSAERVMNASDKLKIGDIVKVKVLEKNDQGQIRLSMKAVAG
jgi:hypothetical protein